MQTKLSTLWTVVLFNMIFRDLHEFARTGYLEDLLARTSGGEGISETLLLAAAIVLQIPIWMVFLSQVLRPGVNRRANLIAAPLMVALTVSFNLTPDLDDAFFAGVEVVALLAVVWYAWRWQTPSRMSRPAFTSAQA